MINLELHPLNLLLEKVEELLRAFIQISPNILAALIFLVLTWFVAWLVKRTLGGTLRRSRMRPALVAALVGILKTIVWLTGLLIAAMIALPGLTPSNALAGLGIGSLAVGLAFKDIFENFLAGILILLREPMRIGDYIECDGVEGQVEQISIRDTYLKQTDGVLVIVPNAHLFKNPVQVLTDSDLRRQTLIVGVAYGEDVGTSRSEIEAAIKNLDTVIKERPIQVFAQEFASSSVNFEVTWWTGSSPLETRKSRDEVVAAIKAALDNAQIEIPFPYRTLTFKEPLSLLKHSS